MSEDTKDVRQEVLEEWSSKFDQHWDEETLRFFLGKKWNISHETQEGVIKVGEVIGFSQRTISVDETEVFCFGLINVEGMEIPILDGVRFEEVED